MDPAWLRKNLAQAAACPRWRDRLRMMAWTYAGSLPGLRGRRREWVIGFRLPPPVGELELLVRANDGSDRFIFSEVFEHRCYDLPLAKPPRTILDLGANCGYAAIDFARRYPGAAIACVEPMADNCRVLRRNLAANGIAARVFEAAADATAGSVTMLRTAADYGSQVLGRPPAPGESTQACASVTVPSIMADLGWSRIGLAKVDIEGHERVLLTHEAQWLDATDALVVEWHVGAGEETLGGIARRHGFAPPRYRDGLWLLQRGDGGGHAVAR